MAKFSDLKFKPTAIEGQFMASHTFPNKCGIEVYKGKQTASVVGAPYEIRTLRNGKYHAIHTVSDDDTLGYNTVEDVEQIMGFIESFK